MKIIVTGGRDFTDYVEVKQVLDFYHGSEGVELLVEGGARGADLLANKWAHENNVTVETFDCTAEDWERYGKAAGNIRNRRMLDAHLDAHVVGFPGPKSRGTWNCLKDAIKRNMAVDCYRLGIGLVLNWKP